MSKNEGIFYFVGPMNTATRKFRQFLKDNGRKNFQCTNTDEIIQGANQIGKTLVFFADASFALDFLADNPFATVDLKLILLMEKDGMYKAETIKQLSGMRMSIYTPETLPKLVADIKNYLAGKDDVVIEELEFLASPSHKKGA